MLPFTRAFVPVVDIPGRRIVADPPAGIFDGADASPEPGEDSHLGSAESGEKPKRKG